MFCVIVHVALKPRNTFWNTFIASYISFDLYICAKLIVISDVYTTQRGCRPSSELNKSAYAIFWINFFQLVHAYAPHREIGRSLQDRCVSSLYTLLLVGPFSTYVYTSILFLYVFIFLMFFSLSFCIEIKFQKFQIFYISICLLIYISCVYVIKSFRK